jgi:hypothetical protein
LFSVGLAAGFNVDDFTSGSLLVSMLFFSVGLTVGFNVDGFTFDLAVGLMLLQCLTVGFDVGVNVVFQCWFDCWFRC